MDSEDLRNQLYAEKLTQFIAIRLDTPVAGRLYLLYKSGAAGKDDIKDCIVDVLSRCDPCKILCLIEDLH